MQCFVPFSVDEDFAHLPIGKEISRRVLSDSSQQKLVSRFFEPLAFVKFSLSYVELECFRFFEPLAFVKFSV